MADCKQPGFTAAASYLCAKRHNLKVDQIKPQSDPSSVSTSLKDLCFDKFGISKEKMDPENRGDHTKYVPFDPENFDPERFFFGPKFDSCDPARDPKLLDVFFDDQSPGKVEQVDPDIGVWDDYCPSYPGDSAKYFPLDAKNFSFGGLPAKSKPCYPEIHLKMLDNRFDDQSPDLK
ncbi:hypothetical protein POM88_051366 [Heracleum sosnowskyi]|uniref:Uncharacterized protein n=1 Tax=Heracleum sosnowskyi TaxID=360622 RepID=A0AAD8M174_9APIA|nr:hypothetical protein POM88_051366 [Heracleum sosnowskyi]